MLAHTFLIGRRAAIPGAFQSAALLGSALGVVIGGAVAAKFGWRYAFFAVGAPGLLLSALYPFVVRDYQTVLLEPVAGTGRAGGSAGFGLIIR